MSDWLSHIGGVSSALSGLDMSMPGDGAIPLFGVSYWGYELTTSVLNGSVPVDRLNDSKFNFFGAIIFLSGRIRSTLLLVPIPSNISQTSHFKVPTILVLYINCGTFPHKKKHANSI